MLTSTANLYAKFLEVHESMIQYHDLLNWDKLWIHPSQPQIWKQIKLSWWKSPNKQKLLPDTNITNIRDEHVWQHSPKIAKFSCSTYSIVFPINENRTPGLQILIAASRLRWQLSSNLWPCLSTEPTTYVAHKSPCIPPMKTWGKQ